MIRAVYLPPDYLAYFSGRRGGREVCEPSRVLEVVDTSKMRHQQDMSAPSILDIFDM
jgi:hypothetical protein